MSTSTPARRPRVDDVVRIRGLAGTWRVTETPETGHITATSLHAYPRVDATVPAAHIEPTTSIQE